MIVAIEIQAELLGALSTVEVTAGSPGGGSVAYFGEGVPDDGNGVNGDTYTDTTGGGIYKKVTAAWVLQVSFMVVPLVPDNAILGGDGEPILGGDGEPILGGS